ncbi:DUF397 domain-containing protein [Streptomyces gamaensis]|uniref:DUF397 domain-containing protein n=1 Tax=Streptomyces gamaensis TaxID=1763542 RepID=A0ABW0YSN8_9ACTN
MHTTRIDQSIATWRKSSHSNGGGGCIEISEQYAHVIPIRDSKNPDRKHLTVPRTAWPPFVTAAVNGNLTR